MSNLTDIAPGISPAWSSLNSFSLAGVVVIILTRRGIGHKRLIWSICTYLLAEGFRSMSVALSLHEHAWTAPAAVLRLIACLMGSICVVFVVLGVRDICKTLVESEQMEVARSQKAEKREIDAQSYRNLIVFGSEQFRDKAQQELLAQRGG